MIKMGLNEFIRNIRKNVLVIVQMVVVYIIALFTISAFEEQYSLMDGVSNIFDDTGMIMFNIQEYTTKLVHDSEIVEKLKKVEKIEHSINWYFWKGEEDSSALKEVRVLGINTENITYVPKLLKGKWGEEVEKEEGIINTVVSNDIPFEVEIGQIIEKQGYKFKITGIISSDELIYGISSYYGNASANYMNYYSTWNDEKGSKDQYLFIVPYETLKTEIIEKEGVKADLGVLWGSFATIDYEDDITEEDMLYNLNILKKECECELNRDVFYTKDMYDYSWRLINIKIMPMIVLLVIIILALIISMVISASINVLYEKKNYGIYFICGNNWSNTFKFSFVSWTLLIVTSIVIALCGYTIIGSLKLFSGLSLTFGWMHLGMMMVITLVLLVITMIIPYVMLRKIQPVSILKENNK